MSLSLIVMKPKLALSVPLLLLLCLTTAAVGASPPDQLVLAKPFGPTVSFPDPAKGSNGWYTNEAGVTETLLVLDFDMNLKPWLADSYKNIGPLSWEIKLRKGVRFHDDTPFNAPAVKWAIQRMIDEGGEVFNKRIQGLLNLREIVVQDEHTLIFHTREPNAAFLYDLTSPATGIISSGSNSDHLYGTGPFVVGKGHAEGRDGGFEIRRLLGGTGKAPKSSPENHSEPRDTDAWIRSRGFGSGDQFS